MASEDGKRGVKWDENVSRALSKVLRHTAEQDGLKVQPDGFVPLKEVLEVPAVSKIKPIPSIDDVKRIVATNDKQRFSLKTTNGGTLWIRANQGHSLAGVTTAELLRELTLDDVKQLPAACHGTYEEAWKQIAKHGLSRMTRRHIHIASEPLGSKNTISGMRGNVQVLVHIDIAAAMQAGIKFYMSDNNVILTEGDTHGFIPPKYFAKIEHVQHKSKSKSKSKYIKSNPTATEHKQHSSAPTNASTSAPTNTTAASTATTATTATTAAAAAAAVVPDG